MNTIPKELRSKTVSVPELDSEVTPATRKPRVLLMTSQLLTDRMLLFSSWLKNLTLESDTTIWVAGLDDAKKQSAWKNAPGTVERFPEVRPFKEFPYNYLRRFNELTWDYYLRPPSRISMLHHVKRRQHKLPVKMLYGPAKLAAATGQAQRLETFVEKSLLWYERSGEAKTRLSELNPDVVVTTDPFCYLEPAVVGEARNLGMKTLAVITSWDNLSTKNRMVFRYDGYVVWSEQMKMDLHRFYPHTREVPCFVVGAPQFDVFFQDRFQQSRAEFCQSQGLNPDRPIVLYALGSPNFLKEIHGAVEFARRLSDAKTGEAQILLRPHPMFFNGKEADALRDLAENVVLQRTGRAELPLGSRIQDDREILDWVNTFRHADVVVNLSSTVAIDAAIFDKPVVNLDFDPEPGHPNQALVKDVNHLWTHFKPIAESGGMWLANDMDEVVHAVREYLAHPELHREKRRWMAEYVCGHIDGKCGERMANAILDFVQQKTLVK